MSSKSDLCHYKSFVSNLGKNDTLRVCCPNTYFVLLQRHHRVQVWGVFSLPQPRRDHRGHLTRRSATGSSPTCLLHRPGGISAANSYSQVHQPWCNPSARTIWSGTWKGELIQCIDFVAGQLWWSWDFPLDIDLSYNPVVALISTYTWVVIKKNSGDTAFIYQWM